MQRIKVNSSTPEGLKKPLISFISKYGDNHITKKAINWFNRTPFSEITKEKGDAVHIIINDRNKIIAMIGIVNYGLEQAIIVVHPKIRKTGIAQKLTNGVLDDIDRYYVKVANDNIPSLKLCFSIGMRAFNLIKGPTGKPTLVLGFGNWNSNEWFKYNK